MTSYERPKGSGKWRAKFVLNGEQVHVPGSPFPSESAADEAEKRHRDYLTARKTDETCASWGERWLAEFPRPASSTRQLYAQAVARFIEAFGPRPLDEPDRLEVRTWALGVPRNISKIVGTMYEDARNFGVLTGENPASNLRLPNTEKTEDVAPPTEEEYRAIMRACLVWGPYAPEARALINFTAGTGLRGSEVQAIHRDDIRGDRAVVDPHRGARKDDGTYGPPKKGSAGEVVVPPAARVMDQVPVREGSPYAFHTPRGEPLKKGNLYYIWNKVRDASGTSVARIEAGIPPVRFHDLRHKCATDMLELGADHFAVSVQLRHSDGGALVMSRYGHPSKDAARERLLGLWPSADGEIGSPIGSQEAQSG